MWKNILCLLAFAPCLVVAFAPSTKLSVQHQQQTGGNSQLFMSGEKKGFFANFFEELDAFVDDATSRRLGNGAQYYGKRKSSFYGKDDTGKKADRNVADPTEDYQGPTTAGYFKWMPDENGQMRPVTRMKEKNIERNQKFWDREYANKDE